MPRQMLKTEGMKLFQPRLGGRSTLAHKMTYYEINLLSTTSRAGLKVPKRRGCLCHMKSSLDTTCTETLCLQVHLYTELTRAPSSENRVSMPAWRENGSVQRFELPALMNLKCMGTRCDRNKNRILKSPKD